MSSPAPEVAAADEEKPAVAPPAAPVDVFATEEISHSLDYIMAMGQGLDADKEYTATLDNLIGQAQSGSGKTATFVLGMLYRATKDTTKRVQSLCLAPTRELARQIMAVVTVMGSFCGIETFLAIPGNEVEKGQHITAQIVVGTPGRVESLVKKRTLDLTHLKKMVPNHNTIMVKKERLSLDEIKQFWIDCKSQNQKAEVLSDLFGLLNVGKSVIFVHTRETAKKVTANMREKGHKVGILHGADMAKEVRDQVLDDFRLGTTKVLITTNVLARGIDVMGVSLVINYDIPVNREGHPDPETYLHRIGRTGRFGRKGAAINFVYDTKSKMDLAFIENYYEKKIEEAPVDDLEALEKLLAWT
ncbi:hypothetical protein DYB28_005053 [Aphanomyces astaci]|nr:hypothetical protein DYB28_005053 [Aphanomyces astaci]